MADELEDAGNTSSPAETLSADLVARPPRHTLPADDVREFRQTLNAVLSETDAKGRRWADAQWGAYAFYDYDGEPIYVGQTNERLRTRVRRHLTNQRTDAVAMRILDIFEVAEIELWPLWNLEGTPAKNTAARQALDSLEHSAYIAAIAASRFKAILNEKIPPTAAVVPLPSSLRRPLISRAVREQRGHPDIRIARRAETLSRLAAVARERGEVSDGLRRVLVIQAVRLAHLAAVRLAEAEGRPAPDPGHLPMQELVGNVLFETGDHSNPDGE